MKKAKRSLANSAKILNRLKDNQKKLQADTDVVREVSFGHHTDTKSLIDETPKSLEFGVVIDNPTSKAIKVAIFPFIGRVEREGSPSAKVYAITSEVGDMGMRLSEYPSGIGFMHPDRILEEVGADCFLTDGGIIRELIQNDPSDDFKVATATTLDNNRLITEFMRYCLNAPTRITKFTMTSQDSNGNPESSNYNNNLKSMSLSPFEDTVSKTLPIRSLRKDQFQDQLLSVDFQMDAPGINSIISEEDVLVVQVNSNTQLSLNIGVGAQMSLPQWMYRIIKKADNIIRPLRRGV